MATVSVFAQTDIKAPYQKFKSVPPFQLLLPDSTTYYTKADLPKNKSVLLILFSPMCEHCQHETEEIIKNIDEFKNVQIVMSTSLPFDSMLAFRERYHLADYPNIVVAHDPHFFLIPYFQLHNMPFMAFYNRKKELISVHEGSWGIENVIQEIKK
jgi:hypothetical protein